MIETTADTQLASRLPPVEETGTRLRILEAGLESFAVLGYHGTSIRAIAASADMQSASLYAHFPAKEDILDRLVRIGSETHNEALTTALVATDGGPAAQIRALVKAHVAMHAQYSLLAVVTNVELRHLSDANRSVAEEIRGRSLDLLVRVVNRGIDAGTFTVAHEPSTIAAIAGLGLNTALWYPRSAVDLSPGELGEASADLALRMLGAA